jgi:hypothetical protein
LFSRFAGAGLLAAFLAASTASHAACLTLAGHPVGAPLTLLALPPDDASFSIVYTHSVTRTPVTERYRVTGSEIVETEIRFEEHGPGLPTEADAGGTFSRADGRFVVTMDRHLPEIVMQVHRDQAPRIIAGTRSIDLAQWGNRALTLGAIPGSCPGPTSRQSDAPP